MELVTGDACSSLVDLFTVQENLSASKPMWRERGHDSILEDFEPPEA
jgi:hypothetical protein